MVNPGRQVDHDFIQEGSGEICDGDAAQCPFASRMLQMPYGGRRRGPHTASGYVDIQSVDMNQAHLSWLMRLSTLGRGNSQTQQSDFKVIADPK